MKIQVVWLITAAISVPEIKKHNSCRKILLFLHIYGLGFVGGFLFVLGFVCFFVFVCCFFLNRLCHVAIESGSFPATAIKEKP